MPDEDYLLTQNKVFVNKLILYCNILFASYIVVIANFSCGFRHLMARWWHLLFSLDNASFFLYRWRSKFVIFH